MDSILTLDIGSTSMRAVHHDQQGRVLHSCRRSTVPTYGKNRQVELDCTRFVSDLLSLLNESTSYALENSFTIQAISVTSQRSSVVPVDANGEPLAPIIMWHDKRTVPMCHALSHHEDRVYELTGLRISPVLSAVKMAWIRHHQPEIYSRTIKMLGIQDVVIHTLTGLFVTDESLASNTTLLNLRSRSWDEELLEIFTVKRQHLCDLVVPGTICGNTTEQLKQFTGIPSGTPVVTAGGDQQAAALGLGIIAKGKLKCTTGTGSYLVAYSDVPILDEKKRFLCKIGSIPESYNIEAGMLTTGTVYRWLIEKFYGNGTDPGNLQAINQELLQSPPGAGGVSLFPHFEGSGAPHWNPEDCGTIHGLKLASTRGDMARAVLEGIVMEMNENVLLFKEKIGRVDEVHISGGMTKFEFYNQLQADIFGSETILHSNRESTSLGAWIAAALCCGIVSSYEQALAVLQPAGSETQYYPDTKMHGFYNQLLAKRRQFYRAMQTLNPVEEQ